MVGGQQAAVLPVRQDDVGGGVHCLGPGDGGAVGAVVALWQLACNGAGGLGGEGGWGLAGSAVLSSAGHGGAPEAAGGACWQLLRRARRAELAVQAGAAQRAGGGRARRGAACPHPLARGSRRAWLQPPACGCPPGEADHTAAHQSTWSSWSLRRGVRCGVERGLRVWFGGGRASGARADGCSSRTLLQVGASRRRAGLALQRQCCKTGRERRGRQPAAPTRRAPVEADCLLDHVLLLAAVACSTGPQQAGDRSVAWVSKAASNGGSACLQPMRPSCEGIGRRPALTGAGEGAGDVHSRQAEQVVHRERGGAVNQAWSRGRGGRMGWGRKRPPGEGQQR